MCCVENVYDNNFQLPISESLHDLIEFFSIKSIQHLRWSSGVQSFASCWMLEGQNNDGVGVSSRIYHKYLKQL